MTRPETRKQSWPFVAPICRDQVPDHRCALGVDAIRRKSVRQVQLLMDRARARGLTPRTPDDPDRPPDAAGYRPIDWYLDPVSGQRFPRGVYYSDLILREANTGSIVTGFAWLLSAFVRGKVHLHFTTPGAAEEVRCYADI